MYYSINDDILKISIGMNYNCAAYFEVAQYLENQNLEITLNDTTFGTAKCICYYNFDIYFSGYNYNPYYLKIYLYKRGQASKIVYSLILLSNERMMPQSVKKYLSP